MFRKKTHLEMIDTTSKMSLKMSCLKACDNNVSRASELYEFLASDIVDLPDMPPVTPGGFDKVKQSATEIFGWITAHKDDVAQGISFLQSLRKPGASTIAQDIPPIPKV